MIVEIHKWDDYNPRKDIKRAHWFRLENTFFTDNKFFKLTHVQKLLWIALLCEASKEQRSTVEVCEELLATIVKCTVEEVNEALEAFKNIGVVTLRFRTESVQIRTQPVKTRTHAYGSVRKRNATEQDITLQNRTEHNSSADLCPGDGHQTQTGSEIIDAEIIEVDRALKAEIETTNEDLALGIPTPQTTPKRKSKPALRSPGTPGSRVWESYRSAYAKKYGHDPVRNQKTNANCAHLVTRLGEAEAVQVVEFYLSHNDQYYTRKCHPLGLCLQDAEGLRTQMVTGRKVTSVKSHQMEKSNNIVDAVRRISQKWDERERGSNGTET